MKMVKSFVLDKELLLKNKQKYIGLINSFYKAKYADP